MIVIPMSRGRLAKHFTKAKEIAFFSTDGQLQRMVENPALGGNCSDKSAMLNLIKQQGAQVVLVHHIGERMLGKLLDAGISVCRPKESWGTLEELLDAAKDTSLRLLDTSTANPSLKHATKGECGCHGGGCHHKHGAPQSVLLQHASNDACNDSDVHFSGFRLQK
ncbi:NifB/NifX family molybdenum-iron cluster-binding protein [Shewanella sp. YIC-542]|uniref:NifB/NifX family molybdenum-iron cluster-binding protein n=1 Tax=Shewanella mytili TaxID=3377111 RepID=UPI00398F60FD